MLNIHPAIVHIPIGLLTLYAILEIFSLKVFTKQNYWLPLKAILVIAGFLGALAGLQSGELLEHRFGEHAIVELHASFASASTWVFGIMAVAYLLVWLKSIPFLPEKYFSLLRKIAGFFTSRWIALIMALIGFILLSITGALGGGMVHGANADPIVKFVFDIFVK